MAARKIANRIRPGRKCASFVASSGQASPEIASASRNGSRFSFGGNFPELFSGNTYGRAILRASLRQGSLENF